MVFRLVFLSQRKDAQLPRAGYEILALKHLRACGHRKEVAKPAGGWRAAMLCSDNMTLAHTFRVDGRVPIGSVAFVWARAAMYRAVACLTSRYKRLYHTETMQSSWVGGGDGM
jgi:hypothetical protein